MGNSFNFYAIVPSKTDALVNLENFETSAIFEKQNSNSFSKNMSETISFHRGRLENNFGNYLISFFNEHGTTFFTWIKVFLIEKA